MMNKMQLKTAVRLQLITLLLISIYLSTINVDAFLVNDRDNSGGASNLQSEDIYCNNSFFANKFKCPQKFGAFPDIEDCGKFYICFMGFARRMPCPPFHHFDKHRRHCMSMVIAICDKGEEETTILEETETIPDEKETVKDPEFLCPEISGTFPHSTDCSKYYTCDSFEPSLQTCPEKELFDGIKKECKPENEVNCGSRERPTSETTLATTPLFPESTPEEEITISDITAPGESTTPVEEQTAPETDCDEDDLDCIITETGEIPKWFKCPVDLGSFRHPSSKKLFIFCINWKPYVKKCGVDLVFSQELKTCVLEEWPERGDMNS